MGSDGPVALSVLGSISVNKFEQCNGWEGNFQARCAGSMPSCSGGRSPIKFHELRCSGDDYQRAAVNSFPARNLFRRTPLNLKTGQRLSSFKISTHYLFEGVDVPRRRGSSKSVGVTVDEISALCSSIGTDATRSHLRQLPSTSTVHGTQMDRCARRGSPPGKRDTGVIAAATADSDQTMPSQNGGGEKSIPTKPHPEVHPAEVVQAQLKALREKDLATVFEFASPTNKARTGPLPRFSEMLEGRAYNVMIGHVSAEILSTITISSNRFQQRVVIQGSTGNQATFQWSLSYQEEGPYAHCWMTDAVRRDE